MQYANFLSSKQVYLVRLTFPSKALQRMDCHPPQVTKKIYFLSFSHSNAAGQTAINASFRTQLRLASISMFTKRGFSLWLLHGSIVVFYGFRRHQPQFDVGCSCPSLPWLWVCSNCFAGYFSSLIDEFSTRVLPDTIRYEGIPTSALVTLCSPYALFGHAALFRGTSVQIMTLSLYQDIFNQTIDIILDICAPLDCTIVFLILFYIYFMTTFYGMIWLRW